MNRRGFLGVFVAAVAGATLDPEKLLWRPGAKLISIPKPAFLAVGDILTFGPYTERYIVTSEARSIDRIQDARFRIDSPPSGYLLPHEGLYCSKWPEGLRRTA